MYFKLKPQFLGGGTIQFGEKKRDLIKNYSEKFQFRV